MTDRGCPGATSSAAAAVATLLCGVPGSQRTADGSLVTVRPDVTRSSRARGADIVQIESAVTFAGDSGGGGVITVGEIPVRWGVLPGVEARCILSTSWLADEIAGAGISWRLGGGG